MTESRRGALGGLAAAMLVAVVAACGDDPTDVPFEVIDQVEYADAFVDLNDDTFTVDLGRMTEKPSGVWLEDLVVGVGDSAIYVGDTLFVTYTGWLRDGTVLDAGKWSFVLGNFQTAIPGWHYGAAEMKAGGERLVLIPPELAYGSQPPGPPLYPGAVLVFHMVLDSLHVVSGAP